MAEIVINADQKRLTETHTTLQSEGLQPYDNLLETLSLLYQIEYGVPEDDISKLLTDFHAVGETEPLQINTWWTPTENWPIERMLDVGSWQIALAINQLDLPEGMLVSSTIEQKGVDSRLNKTVFVMGERDEKNIIHVYQEKPVVDGSGNHIIVDDMPQYETVEVEYTQADLQAKLEKIR